MKTTTLSNNVQLTIPKTVCEVLDLEVGQKFTIVIKGKVIELVPMKSMEKMRGIFKGSNPDGYRGREGRA